MIEYASETELESHALVATARLPTPAADIRVARSAPDPVEGLWELGDQFMTIDLGTILKNAAIGRDFVYVAAELRRPSAAGCRFAAAAPDGPPRTAATPGSLVYTPSAPVHILSRGQPVSLPRGSKSHCPPGCPRFTG